MSNIQAARAALEAELKHTQQGAAYYQAMVERIEQALAQLTNIDVPAAKSSKAGAKKRGPAAKAKPAARGSAKRAAKPEGDLPFTGGDYWINLLSDQPKSGVEILKAAVDSLGFAPTKEQFKKLSGRMIFTLRQLLAQNKIKDSGAGRERRYYRAG